MKDRCPHVCGGEPIVFNEESLGDGRCPHVCGGEPIRELINDAVEQLSPRVWG